MNPPPVIDPRPDCFLSPLHARRLRGRLLTNRVEYLPSCQRGGVWTILGEQYAVSWAVLADASPYSMKRPPKRLAIFCLN